ncbi:MAG: acetylglutamate kinase [Candidatus Margulisbacteria bacterium GWF2_35_9]|nr:MAG: acetylglutamate kinase [Candidatus Margulisbacteria bacterium GWF2_35_9]
MIKEPIEKAKILLEALPYIQKFAGKTIVIKYGGSAMEDPIVQQSVATDIVLLKFVGINPVVVHGGGKEITSWLKKLNINTGFIDGQRVTNKESMEVIEMVLAGKVNKTFVNMINNAGGKAVGLCGKDAGLIQAKQSTNTKLGLVGDITNINTDILNLLEQNNFIPVISTTGADQAGNSYNINADYAACEIAIKLKAEKFILLSNVEGILDKSGNKVKQVTLSEIDEMIANGTITEGMIPKVESVIKAVQNGVKNAHIISGEIQHSLLLELFTDFGIGTMIK